MKFPLRRLNNTGDTLVEVLIAMAIVSTVLGGAYVTSNRSVQTNRESQERVEALKNGETMIERLRVSSIATDARLFDPVNNDFCIAADGTISTMLGTVPSDFSADPLSTGVYPSACISAGPVSYYTWIHRDGRGSDRYQFTVHTRWAGLRAAVNESVLYYRLNK